MKFGPVPIARAEGAILAHSQRTAGGVVRKGTVVGPEHVDAFAEQGLSEVTVARLDDGDLHEDEAARRLADALAGPGVTVERADTGRSNLFADNAGVLVVSSPAVDAFNAVDPAITLATLPAFVRVPAGKMVGTVKIIPFAAQAESVASAEARAAGSLLRVAPWTLKRVAAISTTLPSLKESVIDKTLGIFAKRIAEPGAEIVVEDRVPHAIGALATSLQAATREAEIAVVFGASAVVDAGDVIPQAIRLAGGTVAQVGMPVDPGNLLVLGEVAGRPVIGAPGCARSPKVNGFDWVLDRLLAGLDVTAADITGMGVGGLLTDTAARPRPRRGAQDGAPRNPAAVVLAAGRSSRMGGTNKLLEEIGGKAMVRSVVEAALASRADPVVVVTGHEASRVGAALSDLPVSLVHNREYADGLSTSLRAGLSALPERSDAALIMLGDMPFVRAQDCDSILDGLSREGALVAIPTAEGRRGNPVAWSSRLFPELRATEGDAGGRTLLSRYADSVANVEIGEAAATDADTPAALAAIRARVAGTG